MSTERKFRGDMRDQAAKEELQAILKESSVRLNLCYYDETLGDHEINIVGHKVGLGAKICKSLKDFVETEGILKDSNKRAQLN